MLGRKTIRNRMRQRVIFVRLHLMKICEIIFEINKHDIIIIINTYIYIREKTQVKIDLFKNSKVSCII